MEWINFKGYTLKAPEGFLESSIKITGRCGPGRGFKEKLVPDSILRVDITPACKVHDYHYVIGQTKDEKDLADIQLFANGFRIVKQDSKSKFLSFLRTAILSWYFLACAYAGDSQFKNN